MNIKIEINPRYDEKYYRALVIEQIINGYGQEICFYVPVDEDPETYAKKICDEMVSSIKMMQEFAQIQMIERFRESSEKIK